MAHGSPRLETCKTCNIFGLTPRFSQSKCPQCGGSVDGIERDEVKRILGVPPHDNFFIGFTWHKLEKQ